PPRPRTRALDAADAFVWNGRIEGFQPVMSVNRVDRSLLVGIDGARDTLFANTMRFAEGLPANNALLWGTRGMGKSSLVKATHATVNHALAARKSKERLKLVEIHREDIDTLPDLMGELRRL